MHFLFILIVTILATVINASCPNRALVCQKAKNFGVTFYTPAEMQPILACIEPQLYSNPNDTTTLISTAKTCIINNSASKAIAALSLYSSFNSCTDLMALADKLTAPMIEICNVPITQCLKVLNDCKETNTNTGTAKQNACINKMYGKGLAIVTKKEVNTYCTKISKNMTSTEWNCCKKYAPQVVTVSQYKCYNITK